MKIRVLALVDGHDVLIAAAWAVLLAAFAMGMLCPAARGADIAYPGEALDTDPLFGDNNSLFPGTSLSGNTVTVNSGPIGGNVFGGVDDAALAVSNNRVVIQDGTIGGTVAGGASNNGAVFGNSATLNGGTITGQVNGGYNNDIGAVYNNTHRYHQRRNDQRSPQWRLQ